ncbi:MAG: hypothetical protein ABIA78_03015 [archaeon]
MKIKWWIIIIVIVIIAFGTFRLTGNITTNINTCQDSDFGKNYFSKGEIRGEIYLISKDSYILKDECISDKKLLEYYCVSDDGGVNFYKSSVKFKCEGGCVDGKCMGLRTVGVEKSETCEGVLWCKIKGWVFG